MYKNTTYLYKFLQRIQKTTLSYTRCELHTYENVFSRKHFYIKPEKKLRPPIPEHESFFFGFIHHINQLYLLHN